MRRFMSVVMLSVVLFSSLLANYSSFAQSTSTAAASEVSIEMYRQRNVC